MDLFALLDPRLSGQLREEFERRRDEPKEPLPTGTTVVLAGHRAAGKSTLLPQVARALGRVGVDLDVELERSSGRRIADWVAQDEPSFRRAERQAFTMVPRGGVVAVGGGFLFHHADALRGTVVVLVPLTFETFVDRLLTDPARPRLRPELPLNEELREVYFEREQAHQRARPLSFVDFALRLEQGERPRRVVTLPSGVDPSTFAWKARREGADLLEVRTDVIAPDTDLRPVARALPMLVAERGAPVPGSWLAVAEVIDRPLGSARPAGLVSLHSPRPLSPAEAVAAWAAPTPPGALVKHVEPLGAPGTSERLLTTQRLLAERFGAGRVTVLATGPLALPIRAVLSRENALDYLALRPNSRSAEGQRLVRDALREWRSGATNRVGGLVARLGLLGTAIDHARSPSVHPAPFDRIDISLDVFSAEFLEALLPHYRGLAVTSPFKKVVARAVDPTQEAANTLVRVGHRWTAHNTDVEGASAALLKFRARGPVAVLGDGGAAVALRQAARQGPVSMEVRPRSSATAAPLPSEVVWTWPPEVEAPPGRWLEGRRVGVIAYGRPGRQVALAVRERGGTPVHLGPCWFVAQARAQRALWGASGQ